MIVCTPVTPDDRVGHSWGRAVTISITHINTDEITAWEQVDVSWDSLHDEGSEGSHHARVARFLQEHGIDAVAAAHVGAPMAHMIRKLGIRLVLGAGGDARTVALATAACD